MKKDEVYSLFNSTFAVRNDSNESFYAFRRMLHEFGLIDDALYLSLSADGSGMSQNESKSYSYYYFINEGDIPQFGEFVSNDFGFKSDIIRSLSTINHVIIKDEDGNEIEYDKVVGADGIPYWEKIAGDEKVISVDSPELTSIICNYIIDMQYNYKINDDYFNINVVKFNDNDDEISDIINMLKSWYMKIFDSDVIDPEDWKKFVPFVEDAGIIDEMTKSRILSSDTSAATL